MYRPVALHFQRQLVFLSPNILFTYNSGEASMIITESQLREIIQEETIMYRVLNDGRLNESLLDEGKIKDTKESIMNFFRNKLRKPMTSVVALGIALSLGAAANKSYSPEELGEMGFKPDQIAQVEQGVEALGSNVDSLEIALPSQEVSAADLPEKRTRAEIKDFLDNATEQDLSAEEFDAIVGFQNAFNEKLGQSLSQEELLFQWFNKSPSEQKQLLDQFSIGDQEKTEIMYGLEQIKAKMSPLKMISTPPSFDVPKAPTGMA